MEIVSCISIQCNLRRNPSMTKFSTVEKFFFVAYLLGSQPCEKTFRTVRSMSTIFYTVLNFSILGFLRSLATSDRYTAGAASHSKGSCEVS